MHYHVDFFKHIHFAWTNIQDNLAFSEGTGGRISTIFFLYRDFAALTRAPDRSRGGVPSAWEQDCPSISALLFFVIFFSLYFSLLTWLIVFFFCLLNWALLSFFCSLHAVRSFSEAFLVFGVFGWQFLASFFLCLYNRCLLRCSSRFLCLASSDRLSL